jgi:hypothetical protein
MPTEPRNLALEPESESLLRKTGVPACRDARRAPPLISLFCFRVDGDDASADARASSTGRDAYPTNFRGLASATVRTWNDQYRRLSSSQLKPHHPKWLFRPPNRGARRVGRRCCRQLAKDGPPAGRWPDYCRNSPAETAGSLESPRGSLGASGTSAAK